MIRFTVRNIGARDGVAVPQVYVGPAAGAPVPMAAKSLVGFQRVELARGMSKTVEVRVPARALSYWSTEKHGWVPPSGPRTFQIGFSSRNLPLTVTARGDSPPN